MDSSDVEAKKMAKFSHVSGCASIQSEIVDFDNSWVYQQWRDNPLSFRGQEEGRKASPIEVALKFNQKNLLLKQRRFSTKKIDIYFSEFFGEVFF